MTGILERTVAPGVLHNDLSAFATAFLDNQGDTGVRIGAITHVVSQSSDKADVYNLIFASDAGTNVLEITLFANGTREAMEL